MVKPVKRAMVNGYEVAEYARPEAGLSIVCVSGTMVRSNWEETCRLLRSGKKVQPHDAGTAHYTALTLFG